MSIWTNIGVRKYNRITRTIHPVGQGAFYTEAFLEDGKSACSIIYDCGSFSFKELKYNIDIFLKNSGNIKALFVSHFHSDHINGIEYLLSKRKPSLIVIPKVSPNRYLLDYIYNIIKKSQSSIDFMLRCLPILAEIDDDQKDESIVLSDKLQGPIPVIYGANHIWEYEILNQSILAPVWHEQPIIDTLKKLFPEIDFEDIWKERKWYEDLSAAILSNLKVRKALVSVYKNTFPGGHNSYSMIVHSHKVDSVALIRSKWPSFDCIYTGDAMIDNNMAQMTKKIAPDFIQVPHHGSNENHRDDIYMKHQVAVMSVGEKNRYHHPGKYPLNYIINRCDETHVVSENKGSEYVEFVDFM